MYLGATLISNKRPSEIQAAFAYIWAEGLRKQLSTFGGRFAFSPGKFKDNHGGAVTLSG